MNTIQLVILMALAILGLAMLASVGLLVSSYRAYQRNRKTTDSLLKRLENNPMLSATQPRRKYQVFWNKRT